MRNKKILAIIAVLEVIFASILFSSANAGLIQMDEQEEPLEIQPIGNDSSPLGLDSTFMNDVRGMLTDIIDDGQYWRGKQFGTSGEVFAANNLKNIWDDEIAAGHSHIDDAFLDKVEGTVLNQKLNAYIGTENKDDFKLTLYGLEDQPIVVEYPECSPVHTTDIMTHNYENAVVQLVPDMWYGIFDNGLYTPSDPDNGETRSQDTTYNIYLIDNSQLPEHTALFATFVDVFLVPMTSLPNDELPTADAFILADINENAHLDTTFQNSIPGIMINGSLGDAIISKINNAGEESVIADFYVKTTYFDDVDSYNVVGTINGEVDDVVIIGSHYDTVWGPCAADDAGSNSVVWSLAKYFSDNEIVPYYTLKFIAWAGEEFLWRGSQSYINKYDGQENWEYVITLGALGYKNHSDVPKIQTRLNVWKIFSLDSEPDDFEDLLGGYDYPSMSGGYGDILLNGEKPTDPFQVFLTDGGMFAFRTNGLITIDKGTPLIADHWHHRDGENHTTGNSEDIIDEQDLQASAQVVLGIILNLDDFGSESYSSSSSSSQSTQQTVGSSASSAVSITTSQTSNL